MVNKADRIFYRPLLDQVPFYRMENVDEDEIDMNIKFLVTNVVLVYIIFRFYFLDATAMALR